MKIFPLLLAFTCTGIGSFAQQKYFEGIITYHVTVKSKADNLSDKDVSKILGTGTIRTIACKNGNYRETTEYGDGFTILKDKKIYIKYRKIDTLYYLDYSEDTAQVTDIVKSDSIFKLNKYQCKAITIKTSRDVQRLYYTDSLRANPALDRENTLGKYNIISRETGGSIYLWKRFETRIGIITDSCIRVEQKSIDDHVFDLPAFPVAKYSMASLYTIARFPGKEGAWLKYLNSNLDSKLALKYVKLPKGQSEASVTVQVEFDVSDNGTISNVHVLNKKDVHPRLAEEAVRVIQESPRWEPATVDGEKINSTNRQPIIFKIMQ